MCSTRKQGGHTDTTRAAYPCSSYASAALEGRAETIEDPVDVRGVRRNANSEKNLFRNSIEIPNRVNIFLACTRSSGNPVITGQPGGSDACDSVISDKVQEPERLQHGVHLIQLHIFPRIVVRKNIPPDNFSAQSSATKGSAPPLPTDENREDAGGRSHFGHPCNPMIAVWTACWKNTRRVRAGPGC